MKPLVSIITPLHNKGPFIAETIRSVQSQTFTDWEMIVVENHSTDDGRGIVEKYAAEDARVSLLEAPPEVRGPGAARNLGMQRARGEWIQFLDADDLLLPGHFESQRAAARHVPEADIITCDWLEGAQMDAARCELKKPTNSRPTANYAAAAIAFTPWVVHSAWVKRSALGEAPWWDTRFDGLIAEDFSFWFKLLQRAKSSYSQHTGASRQPSPPPATTPGKSP